MRTGWLALAGLLSLFCDPALAQEADWLKAIALDSAGKHTQAMKIYDRLVDEPAYRYKALMARSMIEFSDQGRFDEAFADIGAAMALEPDSVAPYLNRGSMYLDLRMPERALSDLEQGLKHCRNASDSSSIYMNLGAGHTMVRQFDKALYALERSVQLDPTNYGARSNLATVLNDMGRDEEAYAIYIALYEEDTTEVFILNNLGFLESNRGAHQEAIKWFTKATALLPSDPVVLNNLGFAQYEAGNTEEALKNVRRSIKLGPGNSYAYRNLGIILQSKGEVAEACTAYESALRLGFTDQYGPEVADLRKMNCK
jgi:tetratricopeptide (TPR) repeat protein